MPTDGSTNGSQETLVSSSPPNKDEASWRTENKPFQVTFNDPELDDLKPCWKIQQTPISVTLDKPGIFALASVLVLLIHHLDRFAVEAIIALTPVALLVHNDYQNFLGLGPGGTPSTFRGYLKLSWLSIWCLRDLHTPPQPEPESVPRQGILDRQPLPYRAGAPPVVAGIAPQRQLDQHGSLYFFRAVRQTLENLALIDSTRFATGRSCVEKHGLGLFAKHPIRTVCQGEICHVHDTDHSFHMWLHPDDIKEVLAKGWGRRHPLCWEWSFMEPLVSPHLVMIYAPRGRS